MRAVTSPRGPASRPPRAHRSAAPAEMRRTALRAPRGTLGARWGSLLELLRPGLDARQRHRDELGLDLCIGHARPHVLIEHAGLELLGRFGARRARRLAAIRSPPVARVAQDLI